MRADDFCLYEFLLEEYFCDNILNPEEMANAMRELSRGQRIFIQCALCCMGYGGQRLHLVVDGDVDSSTLDALRLAEQDMMGRE